MKDLLQAIALLWLRLLMGAGIAWHGYGKLFGGAMDKFAENVAQMGIPLPVLAAWAAALSEFVGGILVAVGLGTRYAAFFIFVTMSVAVFVAHSGDPLAKKELALAYWTVAAALVLSGGGRFSLDALLGRGRRAAKN